MSLTEPEAGTDVPGKRRWVRVALPILVAVIAVVFLVSRSGGAKAAKEKAKPAPRPVPVVAVAARQGDMPVTLIGLGTATALGTVTVRSRVDGQLLKVSYREGQMVAPGDLLAELDPRPFQVQLQQAEGQLAKDEAALKNARADLARYEALAAQDAVSRQQLDTQVAAVRQGEATLESDRAQVASARLNLAYCRITAPIGGRVGLRLVDPGNMVRAADPNGLVVVTQLQPIAVVFTIAGDQVPPVMQKIRAGERLPVEAWDREARTKLADGTLEAVDNQIDPATGTVKLKARFANRDAALFPNQFVNARLQVDVLGGAVLVPTAALQRSPQGTFVWAVKPDETVEMRTVTVARTEGETTAVASGLAAGERVVTDGTDRLQPGAKVAVTAPGAAPAAAPSPGGSRERTKQAA